MTKHLHWVMFAVTAALAGMLYLFVDLQPHVGQDFFFDSNDPQLRETKQIRDQFPSGEQLILSAQSADIQAEGYRNQIEKLTKHLAGVKGVTGVKSITSGPDDLEDAIESPLWRRLLISDDGQATNLIALVESTDTQQLIADVEQIIEQSSTDQFKVRISGMPYIVEMMRRSLVRDFSTFTLSAIGIFALAMIVIFRSVRIVIGAMLSCLSAVMLTLLIQQMLGQKIGLLTANLTTIVFVLTLSHIVFMTGNWRHLVKEDDPAGKAWRQTLVASLWCMATTLLGFLSLILVDAKPLRELGLGGSIGTVIAMVCAYGIYPPFLRWIGKPHAIPVPTEGLSQFWHKKFWPAVVVFVLGAEALLFGIEKLNTDPSLLAYFKQGTELHDGLEYIDRNGGSSPLTIVVRAPSDQLFNTSKAYKKMWELQQEFEDDEAVGTVISLPVLMAEADRSPLSWLLTWERILGIMEKPKYDKVAKSFVTEDRQYCLYLLRMKESQRDEPRLEVVERIEGLVNDSAYSVHAMGGIYVLQGHLSKLVSSSLVQGLAGLVGLFTIVAWIVARQWRSTLAMVLAVGSVPICILGAIGWFGIPLDVISAPAANVCIGMAVDAMIHLTAAARREAKNGKTTWKNWVAARHDQGASILNSALIIAAGFAIFALSTFPPTQRFGIAVVFGTVIAAFAALVVLPVFAAAGKQDS